MNTTTNIVNIGGDKNDSFYRYKRSLIEVKTLSKQGGLTQITNMDEILKQLQMPKEFSTAFYKQIKKKGNNMISPGVFRGDIPVKTFEDILEYMIDKYVLCPRCRLPEWRGESCNACGYVKGQLLKKEVEELTEDCWCKPRNPFCRKCEEHAKTRTPVDNCPGVIESLKTLSLTEEKGETDEAKLVAQMKRWYDDRENRLNQGLDVKEIDKLLDSAWRTARYE
jgi:translation initiation factor 2 beta subunit (eIF-2beta)/eIF-5